MIVKLTPLRKPVETVQTNAMQIASLSEHELRQAFAQCLGETAERIRYLAALWSEFVRRGLPTKQLEHGLEKYLPAVDAGTLLAEVVIRHIGNTGLLNAMSQVSPSEQARVMQENEISAVRVAGGVAKIVGVPLCEASPADWRACVDPINRRFVSPTPSATVKSAPPISPQSAMTVRIVLTRTEHDALHRNAAKAGKRLNEFVVELLRGERLLK